MTSHHELDAKNVTWHKNWFDVKVELPRLTNSTMHGIINSLHMKFRQSEEKSMIVRLMHLLRIRALSILFFGYHTASKTWPDVVNIVVTNHDGWWSTHSQEEEDIITSFYTNFNSLIKERKYSEASSLFTTTDMKFGKYRHQRYLKSIL